MVTTSLHFINLDIWMFELILVQEISEKKWIFFRAGNSLIGFLSESLVLCPNMCDSLIRSFLVSNLSDSLTIAHFL